ncbi:alpha/beta hydrolase [Tessaracoccus sp. SD287]|uniref:alpha/beta hydrolase n=1 Tax=Tessaracoccus sp. SD287 TaxID=2782008 RepID=UPI001A96F695|nr:alpha/beta hydrolase [Tessaracoccus sp. SD287]
MSHLPYVSFLPPGRRNNLVDPESTWWSWHGHRVHVARARRPDAAVRLLVVHGAGGHSGALWPLAALVAGRGLDVTSLDLPLYGLTEVPDRKSVRYDDWVRLLVDFVAAEDDGRPLLLLGASIGGLLALEVAARSTHVSQVMATCLLDPSDWRAMVRMTRFGPLGVLGRPLSRLVERRWAGSALARTMIPIGWVANLARMSRNPALSRLCATDPLGGGARVPIGFLTSYVAYRHTAPAQMTTPVTLVHPSHDDWTPVELSMRVLRRVAAPASMVLLRECGHFPVEEPGLGDLLETIDAIVADLAD